MKALIWNVLLMAIWVAGTESVSVANLLAGYALGFAVLYFVQPLTGKSTYFSKPAQAAELAWFFARELVISNLRVAVDVLTPSLRARPALVRIPLDLALDDEILILSILVTLTPGTITVDVSDDRKALYVHAMYVGDPEELRRQIKQGFERRILELLK